MDKIITEIIIGAVILTLLISIIPIYRSSAALVSNAGEKNDINENIKEVTFGRIPQQGDVVSGGYLSEFIYYAAEKYIIEFSVVLYKSMYVIKNKMESDFSEIIKENMLFKVTEETKKDNTIKLCFELYEEFS